MLVVHKKVNENSFRASINLLLDPTAGTSCGTRRPMDIKSLLNDTAVDDEKSVPPSPPSACFTFDNSRACSISPTQNSKVMRLPPMRTKSSGNELNTYPSPSSPANRSSPSPVCTQDGLVGFPTPYGSFSSTESFLSTGSFSSTGSSSERRQRLTPTQRGRLSRASHRRSASPLGRASNAPPAVTRPALGTLQDQPKLHEQDHIGRSYTTGAKRPKIDNTQLERTFQQLHILGGPQPSDSYQVTLQTLEPENKARPNHMATETPGTTRSEHHRLGSPKAEPRQNISQQMLPLFSEHHGTKRPHQEIEDGKTNHFQYHCNNLTVTHARCCSEEIFPQPHGCTQLHIPSQSAGSIWHWQCCPVAHYPAEYGMVGESPLPPRAPHSNEPYTKEQVQFIRYQKEDCKNKFFPMIRAWGQLWPVKPRMTGQCFSSRLYRDNKTSVPQIDEDGNPLFGDDGKPIWVICKVRDRGWSHLVDIPQTLVEKYPHLALEYKWVSKEHKAIARLILSGRDTDPRRNRQARWRRAIRMVEDYAYPVKESDRILQEAADGAISSDEENGDFTDEE